VTLERVDDEVLRTPTQTQTDTLTLDPQLHVCAYHDWRPTGPTGGSGQPRVVRAYSLPLASSVATLCVCPSSGLVLVATEREVNAWACGDGQLEHVLELELQLPPDETCCFLAAHGPFIAYGSHATGTELPCQ